MELDALDLLEALEFVQKLLTDSGVLLSVDPFLQGLHNIDENHFIGRLLQQGRHGASEGLLGLSSDLRHKGEHEVQAVPEIDLVLAQ